MNDNTLQLNQDSFETQVQSAGGPVVVDFWAEWCGPCRALGPVVDKLADEFAGQATVAKVDVDKNPELAQRFGVRSIPTLVFFQDGREVDRVVGALSYSDLQQRLSGLTAA